MKLTQSIKKSLVLLFAMLAMSNANRSGGVGGDSGKVVVRSSNNYIQHLHEQLAIDTSDPREDIRTNRVLNMEGF